MKDPTKCAWIAIGPTAGKEASSTSFPNVYPRPQESTPQSLRRSHKSQQSRPRTPNPPPPPPPPSSTTTSPQADCDHACHREKKTPAMPLAHHIFSKGEWRWALLRSPQGRNNPRAPITTSLIGSGIPGRSQDHSTPNIHADVSVIADTGAQSDLWLLSDFLACGFPRDALHPISLQPTTCPYQQRERSSPSSPLSPTRVRLPPATPWCT